MVEQICSLDPVAIAQPAVMDSCWAVLMAISLVMDLHVCFWSTKFVKYIHNDPNAV
jgi:hypothetical protein